MEVGSADGCSTLWLSFQDWVYLLSSFFIQFIAFQFRITLLILLIFQNSLHLYQKLLR